MAGFFADVGFSVVYIGRNIVFFLKNVSIYKNEKEKQSPSSKPIGNNKK